jgi:hypothetical protein
MNFIKPILAYCLTGPDGKCLEDPIAATNTVEKYISNILGFLTIVAALFFMFRVIFAGYAFISSAGDPKKIEVAKEQLLQGFIGIVVVIAATIITGLVARILGLPNILNLQTMFTNLGL